MNTQHTSKPLGRDVEAKVEITSKAHLIASAPELLAALERFQNEWVVNGNPRQRANNYTIEVQINRAINKAKGIL